eukprot:scaffold65048_cov43-Attheya_sp.AAC.1
MDGPPAWAQAPPGASSGTPTERPAQQHQQPQQFAAPTPVPVPVPVQQQPQRQRAESGNEAGANGMHTPASLPSTSAVRPASSSNSNSNSASNSNSNAADNQMIIPRTPDEETEDGTIRNREAATRIRDAWIYKQIRARADEFTQYRKAQVFCGTWNVNAKGKDEDLDDWLCVNWGRNGEHAPDIVAVGFQEIVDLNAVNVAVDNKSQQRSMHWVERIKATLNSAKHTNHDPMRSYTLLVQKYLVGLLVCVFVKNPHRQRVKYVHSDSVGVGVMGVMGNKGGVSVRLQFYDSTICVVCTHLAAHRENVAGRNADFNNVYTKTGFDIGDEAVKEVIRSGSLSQWATGSSSVGVADHNLVFWIGDLNYRIDESLSTERVLGLSEKRQLDELRSMDQLNIERAKGRVFQGFNEGILNFAPTYKYQPGTDMYEQRPDKKLRAPAWCDRILWMAQEQAHIQQLNYLRSELNCSDHKPVMSTFLCTIKDVIQEKRHAVYEQVMKLLDKFENQTLPMVGLDRINLDFGQLRYGQTITLPIKVTNTGNVVAQFRLVPKLDERSPCKPWMKVSPKFGMLIPGEEPATIDFTISIDNATAQALNSGREVLDDILILRLENGRDYYITVKGTYARSCFGMSVDELVSMAEPVRNIPLDPLRRAEMRESSSAMASAGLCVPKELWRIVDAIYSKGLHERDLFTTAGVPDEVMQIREALDTGKPFGPFH